MNKVTIFEKIYHNFFAKKDYWYLEETIEQQIKNWKYAIEKGDKSALEYTEESIREILTECQKVKARQMFDKLVDKIARKDIESLKSQIRYDQPLSIAIFEAVTDLNLPRTNKEIKKFFDTQFKN